MKIQSYRDLKVWRRGMGLAEMVYRLTAGFPREEQFSLTSQARRAAVSIPAKPRDRVRQRSSGRPSLIGRRT